MMKMKQLIAAAVVLAALTATLYWSNHRKPADDTTAASATPTVKIVSLKQDDIAKLEIKKSGGDDVVLNRAAADRWKITSPTPLFADQDPVSTILYALSPLDNATVVEEKTSDLKSYGLADPAVSVSATGKDGKTQTILVGDDTPTGGSSYAMLSGDPRVFLINSNTKSSLNKGLSDLRDKRLLPVDYDKLTSVQVTGPKLDLTFGSDNGQWAVRTPKDIRGDTSKLENVIEKLKVADIDPSTPDAERKQAASLFAAGAPVATIKATDASGTQELQVRKSGKSYYAKTTAMDGAFKVADALGEAVSGNLEDFREKRLFDFAADNPEKIELHDGAKAWFLTRTDEDWWSGDGKKLDALSADGLLRSIRKLTATKFASGGYVKPDVTLTVISNGGKRVEKVGIAKAGKDYIAKRDGDEMLYELPAADVDDMNKSAADLKPAEAPPAHTKK
ncbi:MAG: DUF4340 domain-containing protein [Acidobacteriia bacterium]|nr:DUF4340 domain-containing protein [Terriglobia bacterium]